MPSPPPPEVAHVQVPLGTQVSIREQIDMFIQRLVCQMVAMH